MSNTCYFKHLFLARCYDQKQKSLSFNYKGCGNGVSFHFAVIMNILVYSRSICSKYVEKRILSKQNITNFKDQLETESWDEVYLHSNANSAYSVFLSKFRKYRQRLKLLCLLKKDVPVRPFFEIYKKISKNL
jgi:hypothetical protein